VKSCEGMFYKLEDHLMQLSV